MSFIWTHSGVDFSLWTGNNTRRRYLHVHVIGLILWSKCEAGEETSADVLCKCEVLTKLGHYCVAFLFVPDDIIHLNLAAFWDFIFWTGQPRVMKVV